MKKFNVTFADEVKTKRFNVTFARYGFVTVEAESEEEALKLVQGYGKEDINWSDEFETSDVQEEK